MSVDDTIVVHRPAPEWALCKPCRAIYDTVYVHAIYPNRCAACGAELVEPRISFVAAHRVDR
jgi:hypothetical protein